MQESRPKINATISNQALDGVRAVQAKSGLPFSRVIDALLIHHLQDGDIDPVAHLAHTLMSQQPGPTVDKLLSV